MPCTNPHLSIVVPACGTVSTTLVAPSDGDYTFAFTYLGQGFIKTVSSTTGQAFAISGTWFNEGAQVVGTFSKDGTLITDTNGVSDLSIQVIKTLAL